MYCRFCGAQNPSNTKYCILCGEILSDNTSPVPQRESGTVLLKCPACGGVMEVSMDRQVISCPYCGSKKLILESDNVKIERIRGDVQRDVTHEEQQANRDISISEHNRDIEMSEIEMKKEVSKNRNDTVQIVAILIIFALALALSFYCLYLSISLQ